MDLRGLDRMGGMKDVVDCLVLLTLGGENNQSAPLNGFFVDFSSSRFVTSFLDFE